MHTVKMKKKESNVITLLVDPSKVSRGHPSFPKAGSHKDKRRLPKVAQRAMLKSGQD